MAVERSRSLRKATGGRLKAYRKPRQYAKVNNPNLATIGDQKVRVTRTIGAGTKRKILTANKISVADSKKKTVQMVEFDTVVDNPANKNYVQRNIFTKGTVVKTKLGNVKITSRPGQSAVLSGVLVE